MLCRPHAPTQVFYLFGAAPLAWFPLWWGFMASRSPQPSQPPPLAAATPPTLRSKRGYLQDPLVPSLPSPASAQEGTQPGGLTWHEIGRIVSRKEVGWFGWVGKEGVVRGLFGRVGWVVDAACDATCTQIHNIDLGDPDRAADERRGAVRAAELAPAVLQQGTPHLHYLTPWHRPQTHPNPQNFPHPVRPSASTWAASRPSPSRPTSCRPSSGSSPAPSPTPWYARPE